MKTLIREIPRMESERLVLKRLEDWGFPRPTVADKWIR